MASVLLGLTLGLVLGADPQPPGETSRPSSPLAPSLPLLSDEEENRLDQTIDRFIDADTGKLRGDEARGAVQRFQGLGPEAIPALIRGLNRAAAIEHSCPAVTIARKLDRMLRATDDPELLEFARENIGAGVTRSRHMGVLRDLRVVCIVRKRVLAQSPPQPARAAPAVNELRLMTLSELTEALGSERGSRLRELVGELGRRGGEEALAGLSAAAGGADDQVRKLAGDLLARQMSALNGDALKEKLKDPRAPVRAAAAVVAGRKQRLGDELIDLLADEDTEVRKAAHDALVRWNRGADLGPAADPSAADRDDAVRKWRQWWSTRANP